MLTEPFTLITDYLLAGSIIYLIHEMRDNTQGYIKPWKYGFMQVSIAAITGGTYHGFSLILDRVILEVLWLITLELVVFANLFFIIGLAKWSFGDSTIFYQMTLFFGIAKLLFLQLFILNDPQFIYVAIDYGITFIFILTIRGITWNYFGRNTRDFKYLILAFILALMVGTVWTKQISLTSWFNYNDIAHIIQIGVMYYIYQAISAFEQKKVSDHRFLKR